MTRQPGQDRRDQHRMTRQPNQDRRNQHRMTRQPNQDRRNHDRMTRQPNQDRRNHDRMTRQPNQDRRNHDRMTRRPNRDNDHRMTRRPNPGDFQLRPQRPGRRGMASYTNPGRQRNVWTPVPRPAPTVINNYSPPVYVNNYNPGIYTDYNCRRTFRPRFRTCAIPFLSLGFFLNRPYSYYDYARVDYSNQPFFYGDEASYQPPPQVATNGGPETLAAANVTPSTDEQVMLTSVSDYIQSRSIQERFRLADAAFPDQMWNLELAQAPAVFEISDGLYSVVAGFEGTLGENSVPSRVGVEFFVQRMGEGYQVRNAWITSANGIPRVKMFQSPVYPEVQTWEKGQICPFSGEPMVEIPEQQG